MNEPKATIDCETRSACSLKRSGAWKYSLDFSTNVLCMAYRLPHWKAGRTDLWLPHVNHATLDTWIQHGNVIECHNAFFERAIWTNILVPQFGFPRIDASQWRCSAAKAAAHALPRALEDAILALRLPIQKDMEGHKVMMKMSKPRKPRKAEREAPGFDPSKLLWWESADLLAQLYAYCRQDVLAEAALSDALADLNPQETVLYLTDQIINERGFQLDKGAVSTALTLIQKETRLLNAELSTLTKGYVDKATKRAQMLKWLGTQGTVLDNTQAETLDNALLHYAPKPPARRGIEIMRTLGRSSTAKYQRMKDWMAKDGKVRGGLVFHGATTGRWSGSGVQPHNFVRGQIGDMDAHWKQLKANRIPAEGIMEALSQGLRGAIIPTKGKTLFVADYAAIEARVVMWLAGDEDALVMFRSGADIYSIMASEIYNKPCNKKDNPDERQVGKTAILGLGFQMGAPKFQSTVLDMTGIEISEELAQETVDAYRAKFWRVKELWADQERAAIQAVKTKRPQKCGQVSWIREQSFLFCELPSGRRLAYPFPEIRGKMTPWGEERPSLTFMGVDPYAHKWRRQHTYGGMLVENIVQAIARDLLAEAILRLEDSGIYEVVLTIHDECLAEALHGDSDEFNTIVAANPDWAKGLPIGVDGWSGKRYKK